MSEWKESASKRRDIRHTKVPDAPTPSAPSKKKDTKKWCFGKDGREHVLECRKYDEVKPSSYSMTNRHKRWRVLVCTKCGKELEVYYGSKKNKPDWVTL